MQLPSLSLILTGIFIAYIVHSIYNLLSIFRVPTCSSPSQCIHSYLNLNPELELCIYTSEHKDPAIGNAKLIYYADNFNYSTQFSREISLEIVQQARYNGSMYLYAVVFPKRKRKFELTAAQAVRQEHASVLVTRITQYAVPNSHTFNLLTEESKEQALNTVTHLKTKVALMMMTDPVSFSYRDVPSELVRYIQITQTGHFLPILKDDFLQTRIKDLKPIDNRSFFENVTLSYVPSSIGKLRFLTQVETALVQLLKLGFTHKDIDEIKGVFADTNVYLLCATVFIGSVHLLFDFLSFKNDVMFWRAKRSMAGLSTRTIVWRAFSQTVIFLFLLDEGTSLLVLIPSGIATVIEFWKVMKVFKLKIVWNGYLPNIEVNTNIKETKEEAITRQYDQESMKYLSYVLYPLCIGAAVYSLLFQSHKSWYSWTINSLVNGVYAFGFLFMLPQLFVNYRLKSVAALPWRAFMYKAFNTFIDDIFAFIITMPTAHRVACFRDDIVFVIYLYQRWLYPVDKSRVDETVGEIDGKDKED